MEIEKNLEIFNMISSKSNFEILNKIIKSNKPIQFKDFRLLVNPKTNKKYSSRTITIILKKFENIDLIETKFIENSKRKNFGYSLTTKGVDTINILKEATSKYEKINKN